MIRIFVNQLPFYVIRSTDIDYVKRLQSISNELGVTFWYPNNIFWGWKENFCAIVNKLFSVLGLRYKIKYKYPKERLGKEFKPNDFDIVYSQGIIPNDIDNVPVFLETTFWIPGQNYPSTQENELLFKEQTVPYMRQILNRNCIVNLKSDCEINNVLRYFPNERGKLVSLPFLLPDLKPINKEVLKQKHEDDEILKILFVGGQANRKGLPFLIEAYCQLKNKNPKLQVELHIVSGYTDGRITIPKGYKIIEHGKLSHDETQLLFQRCHIFAMISARESYGLVYIEAMANGCIVIARDYYPQREILDNGALGFFAKPNDLNSIELELEKVCFLSRSERLKYANEALKKFNQVYSFNMVAPKYKDVFQKLAELAKNRE